MSPSNSYTVDQKFSQEEPHLIRYSNQRQIHQTHHTLSPTQTQPACHALSGNKSPTKQSMQAGWTNVVVYLLSLKL